MGVCCSKTAKETGASSPRHFVSVSGSPSSLPTESECKQDSALARGIEETRSRLDEAVKTASVVDFKGKSSRSVFNVDPAWEAKHRPGEKKDSWENMVHKPPSNGQRSEQSSTENEDGDNKVILLKPRCSGAMRRLKKKDSKRHPNYKDEIMLTDNIDSIVEREIPEVPDDARSLAESPGPGCSHAGITRPSSRRSKKTKVNKLVRSNEPNAKSTTASIAGAIPGPKEIYAKKRNGKACDKTLVSGAAFIVNNANVRTNFMYGGCGLNEQVTAGTVSPKEKAQEAKKKSMRETFAMFLSTMRLLNNLIVDKNIAKDVKDNISMAEEVKNPLSPHKVLPQNKKKRKRKEKIVMSGTRAS